MDGPSVYEDGCAAAAGSDAGRAIRDVLERIGDKWSLLIVATLRDGRCRFTQLQQHVPGISQRMLTRTLRGLERDGLVIRTVHAQVPPRVEYELTHLGATLLPAAEHIATWAVENHEAITRSRSSYDFERSLQPR